MCRILLLVFLFCSLLGSVVIASMMSRTALSRQMFASILLLRNFWETLFRRQCPCPHVMVLVVFDVRFGLLLSPCVAGVPRW